MAGLVFVAVLAAAGMHATWNAIAKLVPDHRVSAGLLAVAGVAAGAVGAVVLPPPDRAAWPYLGLSSLLHAAYVLALVRAYRDGEFGRVYPLARGTAPPLVALVSWGVARRAADRRTARRRGGGVGRAGRAGRHPRRRSGTAGGRP